MSPLRSIFLSGGNQGACGAPPCPDSVVAPPLTSLPTSGLGYCAASHLAKESNILLFLGSRKFEAAEEAITKFSVDKSSKIVPVQLDVTDDASIERAVNTVKASLKENGKEGLDCLVNNAGYAAGNFQEVYAVNVFGVASLTAALKPLLTKSQASIVNVSSELGSSAYYLTDDPHKYLGYPYTSSKHALNGLTLVWAAEEKLNKSNTTVVSICPGYNATNLNNYQGFADPMEGSKIIVKAALTKGGESPLYYNKDGPLTW